MTRASTSKEFLFQNASGGENGRVCPMVGAGCITASQSACESIAAQSGVSSGDQFFTKL
jgi:hypothetical protein